MAYTEEKGFSNSYRVDYLKSVRQCVESKIESKKRESTEDAKRFLNSEKMRSEFIKTLGWPLTEYEFSVCDVKKEFIVRDGEIDIYRVQLKTPIDILFYGMLFVHSNGEKRPMVIAQHGGHGTPELCSSIEKEGSFNYNDMVQRLLKNGVNVFAPQLLLWNEDAYFPNDEEMKLKRHDLDNRLKQIGGSITALEIYSIKKAIDWLSVQPFTDANKIGMTGLSYGGFYTLYTTAVEKRIKAAFSCSFFNDRSVYCWSDYTFRTDSLFFDPEVAMLSFPRRLYIAVGIRDEVFLFDAVEKEKQRLEKMIESAYGENKFLEFRIFDGTHEYIKDDEFLKSFINDLER